MRLRRAFALAAGATCLGFAAILGVAVVTMPDPANPATTTSSAPSTTSTTVATTCQTQAALQKALNKAKAATATTPAVPANLSGCYDTTTPVSLNGRSGITINGNGATINLTTLGAKVVQTPILHMNGDTGITATDLTLNGPYAGTDGGVYYEGAAGALMEDCHDITFDHVNISNVQGDFVDVYPDYTNHDLNTDITWTGSTMTNAGYHGIVPEAVDGLTFDDDVFNKVAVDFVDAEYDGGSTVIVKGQPTLAAEDDITFENDTVKDWHSALYASLQPASPGVQEQGVRLIDLRLSGGAPFVQIEGGSSTNPRYETSGIAITGNVAWGPLHDTASDGGQPFSGSVMVLKNVSTVTILGNDLPIFYGAKPNLGFISAHGVDGLTISVNKLPGALGVVNGPQSSGNTSTVCANRFGANAMTTDGVCP